MSFIFWLTETSSFEWGADFFFSCKKHKHALSAQVKQIVCIVRGKEITGFDLGFGFRKQQTSGLGLLVQIHPSREEEICGRLPTDILPQTGSPRLAGDLLVERTAICADLWSRINPHVNSV